MLLEPFVNISDMFVVEDQFVQRALLHPLYWILEAVGAFVKPNIW
ncbi:hypothetical protein M2263_002945 [Providencia alcalifaciens]|nr:hypothetical protein [Providencia alcalifaciens]